MIRRRRNRRESKWKQEILGRNRSVQIVHTFHVVGRKRQYFASSPCLQLLRSYSVISIYVYVPFSATFRLPLARTSVTHWAGEGEGARAILCASEERQISCSYRESNHEVCVLQPTVWSPHRLHHDGHRGSYLPSAREMHFVRSCITWTLNVMQTTIFRNVGKYSPNKTVFTSYKTWILSNICCIFVKSYATRNHACG